MVSLCCRSRDCQQLNAKKLGKVWFLHSFADTSHKQRATKTKVKQSSSRDFLPCKKQLTRENLETKFVWEIRLPVFIPLTKNADGQTKLAKLFREVLLFARSQKFRSLIQPLSVAVEISKKQKPKQKR